jgi:hypothetical protein
MSVSATDRLASSSISSSGHVDGLGRRSLSFDRETGEMLERVHVQPELAAFEPLIRDRVSRFSTVDDERFACPERVERDPATGELTVLSEFITGSRLSDLLEATADAAIVPGVDVALGYLLESLPALTLLHTASGMTHGLIDASRTVLTPDGHVVFLDGAFGSAVERLNLSRARLWNRFGVASPAGDGAVHLDAASDVSQLALGVVALVLGRNLRAEEYPDAFPSLLMEVIEVAQIRGSASFATGLQRFLQRALPLPGRRPYATAEEAQDDIRQLMRRDIGRDVCRQAVVDFAAQMDAAVEDVERRQETEDRRPDAAPISVATETRPSRASQGSRVPELDQFLNTFDRSDEIVSDPVSASAAKPLEIDDDNDDENETELSLDDLTSGAPARSTKPAEKEPEEVYDLPPLDEAMARATLLSPSPRPPAPVYRVAERPPVEPPVVDLPAFEPHAAPLDSAPAVEPPVEATVPAFVEPPPAAPPDVEVAEADDPAAADEQHEPEVEKDTLSSRRRKRQQQKSARARKDKLRSTTAGHKIPPPPPPVPETPKPASPSGWLVSPQRAAQFEPTVPQPVHVPLPVPQPMPVRPVATVPAVPSFVPTPVGPMPQPIFPSSSSAGSAYGTPSAPQAAPPGPLAPPPVQQSQPKAQVKIKAEPPAGFTAKRPAADLTPIHVPPDRFGTLGLGRADTIEPEEPRAFPWKLAAIAVGVAIIAIVVGRQYLTGRPAVAGEAGAAVQAPTAAPAPAVPPSVADEAPIPAGRGRLVVITQPAGIKVLLDRKPIGETPLKIDAPAGRRMLTFLTTGGEVIQSVRVVAGKTETLDIPVFSGWVSVLSPIVLTIAADGKNIGSTEDSRLMLPPGKHELTLTNKELGYSATQEVLIAPGEVKPVSVNPKGTVNINAIPWAEVWLNGQKLGDTPLAAAPVPLGFQELVFKNPQFGERKVPATIKATANTPVVVDFSK